MRKLAMVKGAGRREECGHSERGRVRATDEWGQQTRKQRRNYDREGNKLTVV
jgi:hypothetical protein